MIPEPEELTHVISRPHNVATTEPTEKDTTTVDDIDTEPPPPPDDDDDEKPTSSPDSNDISVPYTIYTTSQKRLIVLAAAGGAFFSPLSAQIYLPALPSIAADLGVSSAKINLTITTYMIFQGTVPMFIGSLADSGGRRPAYLLCFLIYIAANIGLALAPGYGAVLGLRCLQSAGSSSTVALCMAVVADVVTSAERGKYVGYTVIPIVIAPALGPIIGGVLSSYEGWRSIFWFLTALAGVAIVLTGMFFPETCRQIVGDGSIVPPKMYQSGWQLLRRKKNKSQSNSDLERQASRASETKFKFKPPNVLGSLLMLLEKETGLLLAVSSIIFAGFYCVTAAMPTILKANYHYNNLEIGLMYLPMAVASIASAAITGPAMNWNYKRHCLRLGIAYDRNRQQDLSDFPIEQVRMEVGTPFLVIAGASIIGWGWTLDRTVNPAAPSILSFLLGTGLVSYNNTVNAMLVDIHPGKAGTATAANNFARCLVGAGFTAAIVPLIDAIGVGWAFTFIGGLYFVCIPAQLVLMKWGMGWRTALVEKDRRKKQAAQGIEEVRADGS